MQKQLELNKFLEEVKWAYYVDLKYPLDG